MKIAACVALIGVLVLAIAGPTTVGAQERALRAITRGDSPALQKSMTQSQARRLCQQQMRGARESRASLRQKMAICIRRNMEGI